MCKACMRPGQSCTKAEGQPRETALKIVQTRHSGSLRLRSVLPSLFAAAPDAGGRLCLLAVMVPAWRWSALVLGV